jgi:hypothetical protein
MLQLMLGVLFPGVHPEGDAPTLPKKLSGTAFIYQSCGVLSAVTVVNDFWTMMVT